MADGIQYKPKGAFDGYVVAKLEAITDRLNALPCKESFEKMNRNSNDISKMKGIATGVGLVAGAIGAIVTMLIKWLIRE